MLSLTSYWSLHLGQMKIRHVAAEKIWNGVFVTETLKSCNFSSSRNCGPTKVASERERKLVELFNLQQTVSIFPERTRRHRYNPPINPRVNEWKLIAEINTIIRTASLAFRFRRETFGYAHHTMFSRRFRPLKSLKIQRLVPESFKSESE